jgi:hypothetical protein
VCGSGDGGCGVDFYAEVVQAGVLGGVTLEEDDLERRLGDGEVGVAVAQFGGLGAESFV